MAKHTPGPWAFIPKYDQYDNVFTASRPHRRIASVFAAGEIEDENTSNANLIAAAPDMLEALKMVLQHGRIDDSESRMAQVAAAITKAESTGHL
jgi:hypothetical protein